MRNASLKQPTRAFLFIYGEYDEDDADGALVKPELMSLAEVTLDDVYEKIREINGNLTPEDNRPPTLAQWLRDGKPGTMVRIRPDLLVMCVDDSFKFHNWTLDKTTQAVVHVEDSFMDETQRLVARGSKRKPALLPSTSKVARAYRRPTKKAKRN